MRRRYLLLLLLLAGSSTLPAGAASQTGCELASSRDLFSLDVGGGRRINYVSRPFIICQDGSRIRADSAEIYEGQAYTQFFRNVSFQDSTSQLTADRVHFFNREGRLVGWGRVQLNDLRTGSVITGDTLVHLRAGTGRPEDQLTMTGRRPHATLYPPAAPPEAGADTTAVEVRELPPEAVQPEAGPPDTVVPLPADTAAAEVGDSAEAASPDSLVVPPPDSLGPQPPDTTEVALADSLAIPSPDTLPGPTPDSVGGQPPDTVEAQAQPEPVDTVRVPYEIDADRIVLTGSDRFEASGTVEIERDSLFGFSDFAEYRQADGELLLRGSARLETASFRLAGREITLLIPGGTPSRVVARDSAEAVGENVRLTAPVVRLFLAEGEIERLVAVLAEPPEAEEVAEEEPALAGVEPEAPGEEVEEEAPAEAQRPEATAQDFVLVADSIEVQAPGEVLERLVAVGRAHGESTARDSLNTEETPELIRRDWLKGDTILAFFRPAGDSAVAEPSEPDSTARKFEVDRLIAMGSARTLYRAEPSDTTEGAGGQFAIHYVTGNSITIHMRAGEVDRMSVSGQTRGIQLEPLRRPAEPDTAVAPGPTVGRERPR